MSQQKFIKHINNTRKTAGELYYYMLSEFNLWLSSNGKTMDDFNANDVSSYLSSIDNPNTANAFLAAIKSYTKFRVNSAYDDQDFISESRRYHSISSIEYRKVPRKIEKKALRSDEIIELLEWSENRNIYSGLMCTLYFGWRPIESIYNIRNIDWKNKYILLETAKSMGDERILPFPSKMEPHIKEWLDIKEVIANYNYGTKWLTKRLIHAPVKCSAKTGRKTFETYMRPKTDQWKIDFILGHSTGVPEIYTDWLELVDDIREPMEDEHYLIELGVV